MDLSLCRAWEALTCSDCADGLLNCQSVLLFETATVGTGDSQGSPSPNPFTALPMSNGLFTVVLDFGTGVFANTDRWLEIRARTNDGPSFSTLSRRQKLTPTPYAICASNAANAAMAANATQFGGQYKRVCAEGRRYDDGRTDSAGKWIGRGRSRWKPTCGYGCRLIRK